MLNTFVIISTQNLSSKYNTYIITDLHDITEILLNVALNTIPVKHHTCNNNQGPS